MPPMPQSPQIPGMQAPQAPQMPMPMAAPAMAAPAVKPPASNLIIILGACFMFVLIAALILYFLLKK